MTHKHRIQTDAAPPAVGTYTQAIRSGNLVFVTGQTGRNPDTSRLEVGLEAQVRRALSNVAAVLTAAGCSTGDVVKSTLILADLADLPIVDALYAAWIPDDRILSNPARTVFEAASLPHGALFMLDVIATCPS